MALRITISLLLLSLSGINAHAANKKKRQAGIGVSIKQTSDGVVVAQVLRNTGAWLEGIEKGDVIVSADGNQIKTRQDTKWLIGDACTKVKVVVKRGSSTLAAKDVLRIPFRNGGHCLGYYQFKTKSQRRLRKLGAKLFDEWKKRGNAALESINSASQTNQSMTVKAFMTRVRQAYGVDVSDLESHTNEIVAHMLETMPEGRNGKWQISKMTLRITDTQNDVGAHVDQGEKMIALTNLLGRPTRYHPLGCLGFLDAKQFRQAQASKTLVIQGDRRFGPWKVGHKSKGVKPPSAIKHLAKTCNLDDRKADDRYTGLRHKGITWGAVPHEAPKDQRKRVVFLLNLGFQPRTK